MMMQEPQILFSLRCRVISQRLMGLLASSRAGPQVAKSNLVFQVRGTTLN